MEGGGGLPACPTSGTVLTLTFAAYPRLKNVGGSVSVQATGYSDPSCKQDNIIVVQKERGGVHRPLAVLSPRVLSGQLLGHRLQLPVPRRQLRFLGGMHQRTCARVPRDARRLCGRRRRLRHAGIVVSTTFSSTSPPLALPSALWHHRTMRLPTAPGQLLRRLAGSSLPFDMFDAERERRRGAPGARGGEHLPRGSEPRLERPRGAGRARREARPAAPARREARRAARGVRASSCGASSRRGRSARSSPTASSPSRPSSRPPARRTTRRGTST